MGNTVRYLYRITVVYLLTAAMASAAQLAGDCNDNGVINASDIATCSSIAVTGTGLPGYPMCDVDGNGSVTSQEIERLAKDCVDCTTLPGDCDHNGIVQLEESYACLMIAVGLASLDECRACDPDQSGSVSVAESDAAHDACLECQEFVR